MNKEVKDFIKWCDEPCKEHQWGNHLPIKRKLCKVCWEKVQLETKK